MRYRVWEGRLIDPSLAGLDTRLMRVGSEGLMAGGWVVDPVAGCVLRGADAAELTGTSCPPGGRPGPDARVPRPAALLGAPGGQRCRYPGRVRRGYPHRAGPARRALHVATQALGAGRGPRVGVAAGDGRLRPAAPDAVRRGVRQGRRGVRRRRGRRGPSRTGAGAVTEVELAAGPRICSPSPCSVPGGDGRLVRLPRLPSRAVRHGVHGARARRARREPGLDRDPGVRRGADALGQHVRVLLARRGAHRRRLPDRGGAADATSARWAASSTRSSCSRWPWPCSFFYVGPSALQPALNSYWRQIHVTSMIAATSLLGHRVPVHDPLPGRRRRGTPSRPPAGPGRAAADHGRLDRRRRPARFVARRRRPGGLGRDGPARRPAAGRPRSTVSRTASSRSGSRSGRSGSSAARSGRRRRGRATGVGTPRRPGRSSRG